MRRLRILGGLQSLEDCSQLVIDYQEHIFDTPPPSHRVRNTHFYTPPLGHRLSAYLF
jgi:hypothetical protein